MAITTPVLNDIDAVFPGEGQFYYWKTSAALWESKIVEYAKGQKFLIPLNWSFHSETGDTFDFGETKPETDIAKLVRLAKRLGKEPILFIPVSPNPTLVNGGIPFILAKTLAINSSGVASVFIDGDDNINRMYSFFEPKVFKQFAAFLNAVRTYLEREKVSCPIMAMESGVIEDGVFESTFYDRSSAFHKAFGRFLSIKKQDESFDLNNGLDEESLVHEFSGNLYKMYVEAVKETFPHLYEGVVQVAFIGGSSEELMYRFSNVAPMDVYIKSMFNAIEQNTVPCSALLPSRVKTDNVFKTMLKDIVVRSVIENRLSVDKIDDIQTTFKPLYFFQFHVEKNDEIIAKIKNLKLLDWIRKNYNWNYRFLYEGDDEEEYCEQRVFIFSGNAMNKENFALMLKKFMNGGYVLFDRTGLSEELNRKLEIFLLENFLDIDTVNYQTIIKHAVLGKGKFVIIESEKLNCGEGDLEKFWDKLFSLFDFKNIELRDLNGIEYYFRTRQAHVNELSFDEVRRLSLYNPTSYRQKIKYSIPKNFAFMKIVDQLSVTLSTGQNEHVIDLMPGGSVSLDFGLFS